MIRGYCEPSTDAYDALVDGHDVADELLSVDPERFNAVEMASGSPDGYRADVHDRVRNGAVRRVRIEEER
jgi:hypothetical protein